MNDLTWNTTSSTADSLLSFTVNTSWNETDYAIWPKGIQNPATELKYTPKWHVIHGYMIQMRSMWNSK